MSNTVIKKTLLFLAIAWCCDTGSAEVVYRCCCPHTGAYAHLASNFGKALKSSSPLDIKC